MAGEPEQLPLPFEQNKELSPFTVIPASVRLEPPSSKPPDQERRVPRYE